MVPCNQRVCFGTSLFEYLVFIFRINSRPRSTGVKTDSTGCSDYSCGKFSSSICPQTGRLHLIVH